MIEQRRTLRRRTLLGGKIEFHGRSTFECVIRNLSDSGALLQCDQQIALPDNFDLVIDKSEARRRARVVWRRENAAGVMFLRADNILAFPRGAPRME